MANNGNKGRFSDRIKKIRFNKLKKNKKIILEDSQIMYKNFLKVVAVIPLMVVDNVLDKPSTDNNKRIVVDDKTYIVNEDRLHLHKKLIDKKRIENINVSLIKKKQGAYLKNTKIIIKSDVKETKKDLYSELNNVGNNISNAKKLEKQIIDLIKKDLVKMVNELEIYESELYILNEINNDEKTLNECKKNIKEVKIILEKIEQLKSKYDYLKDNYDFEYLLQVNNVPLIDKIIELRNMFDQNEVRATVSDYKLLAVYKSLYLKVDQIYEKTRAIEQEKLKQEDDLKKRDVDFQKLKENVYDVKKADKSYAYFVEQQNILLNNLANKISKIDSSEIVNYTFKGYGKYLCSSFKYLGLLALNPLRGLFPSIATQTIIARNAISNLRKEVSFEEHRRMVYDAVDYSSTINYAINDLNYTSNMVDNTLNDLIKLKMEYSDKFKKYESYFSEYKAVMDSIGKMQQNMINNKIKIEIMKSKMKKYEKQNDSKMQLVRKLNNSESIKGK